MKFQISHKFRKFQISSIFRIFLAFLSKSRDSLSFPGHFCKIPAIFHLNSAEKSQNSSKNANEKWNFIFISAKIWTIFAEILRSERCKSMKILKISKNVAKWLFGCYRSCRYSRERASQSLRVISFILQSTRYWVSTSAAGRSLALLIIVLWLWWKNRVLLY